MSQQSPQQSIQRDILQRIHDSSLEFSNHPIFSTLRSGPGCLRSITHAHPQHCLDLPLPLTSDLVSFGLDATTAERLSTTYLNAASHLKTKCEASCRASIEQYPCPGSKISPSQQSRIHSLYLSEYTQLLNVWAQNVMGAARTVIATRQHAKQHISDEKSRQTFNHEYVPLLEEYFKHNAFPSHADKSRFAKKTLMTYRQIDVWFQNRRSRAKKEGKTLKKLSSDTPKLTLNLASLEKRMGNWIIPETDRAAPIDSDVSEYEWQADSDEEEDNSAGLPKYPRRPNVVDPFSIKAPPHAFPCIYPPTCDYDPFPGKCGRSTFPTPVWMRRPATSVVEQPIVDLDILIKALDDMNIREGTKKRREKKKPQDPPVALRTKRTCLSSSRRDRSAATFFITTKPQSAPLPSFIRPKIPLRATPLTPMPVLPAIPAPASHRHVFKWPSPQSRPTTLVPPVQSVAVNGKLPGRRKIAPLPKRTPTSTSIAHCGDMPAPSPAVSASPPQSRTPSLGSDSPHTRACSNSSSSPSSTVATPVSSPTSLLEPDYTFSDLFGDTPVDTLSPVDGLQLDFLSGRDIGRGKQSFSLPCGALSLNNFLRVQS